MINTELKAIKSLYRTIPVKETLVTEGKFYKVVESDNDSFTVFDDTNHNRTFFKVELSELFVNFTEDLEGFARFLETAIVLNKNMPIRVYDYQIKQYKSFTMSYIENSQYSDGKQFDSLTIKCEKYNASTRCADLLSMLKVRFGLGEKND